MASGAVASAVTRFDVKRASIVGGAKDVFLRHGFEGASMDEIAAAAGVSKMTVYRYFRSKEQLFGGVIRDLCERIIDEDLERMLERRPEEALRGFARRMVAILFARDTIELHRIVIAESSEVSRARSSVLQERTRGMHRHACRLSRAPQQPQVPPSA